MPANIKRDPAVIEHVNDQVGKASVKAAKSETSRVLKIIAGHKAVAKEIADKNTRVQVISALNALAVDIKAQEATGGA